MNTAYIVRNLCNESGGLTKCQGGASARTVLTWALIEAIEAEVAQKSSIRKLAPWRNVLNTMMINIARKDLGN